MAMKSLERNLDVSEAELVLINPEPYHYITTRLHELAAGTTPSFSLKVALSRSVDFNRVQFIQDRDTRISSEEQQIQLESGNLLKYDILVVGLGSSPETFGIPGMKENAQFMQDLHSVKKLLDHVKEMFDCYKETGDKKFLTIVVGGAGLAGIEYMGELADKIPSLCEERNIPAQEVHIINVEAAPTILRGFGEEFASYAKQQLEKRGVEFVLGTPIVRGDKEGIELKNGQKISAKTVVWTGGVRGNHVLEESGFETVRGRVKVDPFLRLLGKQNVFILGDCALLYDEESRPYPTTAQIAMQEGAFVGEVLPEFLRGRGEDAKPFSFTSSGTMASLGGYDGFEMIGSKKYIGASALRIKKEIELRWASQIGGASVGLE